MGKKFKKRKKDTAHRTPPLSRLDKAIYIVSMSLYLFLIFAAYNGWVKLHNRIAFRDPAVIAYRSGSLAAVPALVVAAGGFIALLSCYESKRPIFGNKTIRYGDYPWKTNLFPLFGPQHKSVQRRPTEQQFRRIVTRVVAGVLAVTLLLLAIDINRRTCLRDDRTIVTYNSLNRPGEPVSIARDCDRITIKVYDYRYFRSWSTFWYYGVIIYRADGKKYEFTSRDFNCGHTDCIRQMLAIKALFSPSQITIERDDQLPSVIKDRNLDEAQAALLRRLFAQP
ncbi:MAG: hypothetical protein IKT99_04585 [Oscillospiraceae bacterium]|nr:hypothetical protein [Oscillospiraceae bacterium]